MEAEVVCGCQRSPVHLKYILISSAVLIVLLTIIYIINAKLK